MGPHGGHGEAAAASGHQVDVCGGSWGSTQAPVHGMAWCTLCLVMGFEQVKLANINLAPGMGWSTGSWCNR